VTDNLRAPVPDLRIVPAASLHAHESHDSQRSRPLMERLRKDEYIINPPVVAPIDEKSFVILDGANRCHALRALGFPHLPVQVVNWESGQIQLDTWNHIVSNWTEADLLDGLAELPDLTMEANSASRPVASLVLTDGTRMNLMSGDQDPHSRNALLCQIVAVYQRNAVLYRSVLEKLSQAREHFPEMVAMLRFPRVTFRDIITAAREKAWIPPGVSRHIISGRALRINYPVRHLAEDGRNSRQKNEDMQEWLRQKLARREVRFYAESTYQFDE